MNVSRRGFLQTMMVAAVGAVASFDPKRGLWVPGATPLAAADAAAAALITEVPGGPLAKIADEILELNDLALRFAQQMANRLERWPGRVLQSALFKHAGGVLYRPVGVGLLDTSEWGPGTFVPARHRIVKTFAGSGAADIDAAAWQFRDALSSYYDMFAPISAELRPGIGFNDTLVGMATDPESGLSARALRYTNWNGATSERVTAFEMAVGKWRSDASVRRRNAYHYATTEEWNAADWGEIYRHTDEEGNVTERIKSDFLKEPDEEE